MTKSLFVQVNKFNKNKPNQIKKHKDNKSSAFPKTPQYRVNIFQGFFDLFPTFTPSEYNFSVNENQQHYPWFNHSVN